ncbi:MAG: hypothetical protein SOR89_06640 [Ndongobacter sp.]|nr:hypothetical protein [Ndongobacter sp.]
MIGRQIIITNRAFTLQELHRFMKERWDTEQYNDFIVGRPTPASIEEYILLPATQRYMVIAYSRAAGGLFSRNDRVILSVAHTPDGVKQWMTTSIPSHNMFFGAWKMSKTMSMEKERKGPAEEALQKYTAYMRGLLEAAGYAK